MSSKKTILLVLLIPTILVVLSYLNYPLAKKRLLDKPPPISLTDPNASYQIVKINLVPWLRYETANPPRQVNLLIGNSPVDPSAYYGQYVSVTGEFRFDEDQLLVDISTISPANAPTSTPTF